MAAGLVALAVVLFLVILFAISAIKVAREYERGIVFRLGRLFPEPKGPGLFLLIPIVDRMVKVDLRTITLQIPPQEVITKDNVPVRVNAVAYFRIVDPKAAIVQIENYMVATSQIAQTTLRSVLGQHSLDELLSERVQINTILQVIIDDQTARSRVSRARRRARARGRSPQRTRVRWQTRGACPPPARPRPARRRRRSRSPARVTRRARPRAAALRSRPASLGRGASHPQRAS